MRKMYYDNIHTWIRGHIRKNHKNTLDSINFLEWIISNHLNIERRNIQFYLLFESSDNIVENFTTFFAI